MLLLFKTEQVTQYPPANLLLLSHYLHEIEGQFWACCAEQELTFHKGTVAEAAASQKVKVQLLRASHFFSLHQNELRTQHSCNDKEIKIRSTVGFQHYRNSMEIMKTCHKHASRMPHSVSITLMFAEFIRLIQWHRSEFGRYFVYKSQLGMPSEWCP